VFIISAVAVTANETPVIRADAELTDAMWLLFPRLK